MYLKVRGISRDAGCEKSLALYFDRRPTDDELRRIQDSLNEAMMVVEEQAKEELLWFIPQTPGEEILMIALRRLHAAVEGKSPQQCARDALSKIPS